MIAAENFDLSASLEDYLEAIFNLAGRDNSARSKDIAKALGVAKPSVTGALRILKKKGMANYKPYDSVSLTADGRKAAAKIIRKHNILKSFFVNVLGVEADTAQKAACKAEHTLGPEVIVRLLSFIEFMAQSDKAGFDVAEEFKKFYRSKPSGRDFSAEQMNKVDNNVIGLNLVKPGQKGRIVKIIGRSGINRRIADMGVVPGTTVKVERVAPLGDPIDIKLKGYHLSLRKEEASKIMVELEQ